MSILETIYNLNDIELEKYVRNRINELEDKSMSSKEYRSYIGFNLDINPKNSIYEENNNVVFVNNKADYYIPLYTKMVYGMHGNYGYISSAGDYYYIDDDNYILEFIKVIRKYGILDDRDLFDKVLWYLEDLFGKYEFICREDMNRLILQDDTNYYKLSKEHKLSNFYSKGNALCTEYSLVAHNILSFLGYNSIFVIGLNAQMNHAFNFVSYNDMVTNNKKNILIDFSMPVYSMYTNYDRDCTNPYIYELSEDIHDVLLNLSNGESLICDGYFLMYFDNLSLKFNYVEERNYSMCKKI